MTFSQNRIIVDFVKLNCSLYLNFSL